MGNLRKLLKNKYFIMASIFALCFAIFLSIKVHNQIIISRSENNPFKAGTGEVNYTIEYYFDGSIDNSKTKTNSGEINSDITFVMPEFYDDYTEIYSANFPLTLTEDPTQNVIKIYYVSNTLLDNTKTGFAIEYYYNGEKDNTKTEVYYGNIGDTIRLNTTVGGSTIQQRVNNNLETGYVFNTDFNTAIVVNGHGLSLLGNRLYFLIAVHGAA